MQLKHTKEELEKFGKYVIQQARANLSRKKDVPTSNFTKKLYNSLEYVPFVTGNGIGVKFYMDKYGKFQDQGVKGIKGGFSLSNFSYKKSSNLIGVEYHTSNKGKQLGMFGKWAKFKKYQARDKKGRFVSYKRTGYALANIIKNYGIKPSMFFTEPFQRAYKRLPQELQKAFVTDIDNLIFE